MDQRFEYLTKTVILRKNKIFLNLNKKKNYLGNAPIKYIPLCESQDITRFWWNEVATEWWKGPALGKKDWKGEKFNGIELGLT